MLNEISTQSDSVGTYGKWTDCRKQQHEICKTVREAFNAILTSSESAESILPLLR